MKDQGVLKSIFLVNKKQILNITSIVAIGWSIFQLWPAVFGFFDAMILRPTHVLLATMLGLLLNKGVQKRRRENDAISIFSWFLVITALISLIYIVISYQRFSVRIPYVDTLTNLDVLFGAIAFFLILEGARRELGWVMPTLVVIGCAYAFGGPYMPGLLKHAGISLTGVVELMVYSTDGCFGIPAGVSADTVFYFILFGAFLEASGGTRLFIDLSMRMLRGVRGGIGKLPIVTSWLFGMVSGSGAGNVVVTGTFTIPLMKKSGYKGEFAAAVEATASTGGQLMPPVMGAAAFVMASMLGVPYRNIVISGMIPGILYYASLYIVVDLVTKRIGMTEKLEKGGAILENIHFLIPIILLVYLVIANVSLYLVVAYSILAIIVVSFFRSTTIMGFGKILDALADGAKGAAQVALACSLAGAIGGILVYTGLAGKLTDILLKLSYGNTFLILVMTMLGCLILGMGVPTTAAYILTAITFVPPLVASGVSLLNAHFFVFYFACLSLITPPVAIATYAAAGIAGTDMGRTGWIAFYYAIAGFLIPFAFVFRDSLLAQGSFITIIIDVVILIVGIYFLGVALVGYLFSKIQILFRILYAIGGMMIIMPQRLTDVIGGIIIVACLSVNYIGYRKTTLQKSK